MMEKEELLPVEAIRRKGDDPPIIEPEIVEEEVVETGNSKNRRDVSWETEFRRCFFGTPPFPLTPDKLARLARCFDYAVPMSLAVFYPTLLRKECRLLLPRPVYGFHDGAFALMLETWARNTGFFRCSAIGNILKIYRRGSYEASNAEK